MLDTYYKLSDYIMYRLFQLCQKIEEQYCLLLSFLVIRFGSSNPASQS